VETTITRGKNIHVRASDRPQGAVILEPGAVIGAAEIGVAATVGKTSLKVVKPPSVAIISTGDELVPVDQTPLPHQIRSSNAATLITALSDWHIEPGVYHLIDDLKGTTEKLKELIETFQILILSGGVSKGKFDYVPQALNNIQVTKEFHKIQQRPGKPFWFGTHHSGTLVFAFPGNPVSSFMCFQRYFKPWLHRCLGLPRPQLYAVLAENIFFEPDLTYFTQVKIRLDHGMLKAHPVEGHGSGDLANLVDADGFMELPRGRDKFLKGECYTIYPFRSQISDISDLKSQEC
jgi:molybdopterin molybdotransferase